MIASLRGTVIAVRDQTCTIEACGVGYSVQVTGEHRHQLVLGEEIFMLTTQIVREDSLSLFGFMNAESQELFEALLGVSGVGPRSAMAVLSEISPAEAFTAVVNEDDAPFRKVSGIGPKTAKLIVVQLSGKLSALAGLPQAATPGATGSSSVSNGSVVLALTGLGWNEKTAKDVVERLLTETPDVDNSELLRAALASLAKGPS